MRRTLLVLFALGPLAISGVAAADPAPPGEGTVTVRAITGSEPIAVNRADITLTPCDAEEAVATLVSGADGRASVTLPAGCYEAAVATVPGGCGLRDHTPVRLTVRAGEEAEAEFRFGCA